MKKFPKIKYPNDSETDGLLDGDVVVTEKLDGANFRFTWDEDGKLLVGTRNHSYEWDDVNLPKAFGHAVEYLQDTVPEVVAENSLLNRYTFFGEAMHLHSLEYDDIDWYTPSKGSQHVPLDSDTPNVILFDAWDSEEEQWVDWEILPDLSTELNIPTSDVLEKGDPDDCDFEIPDESMFGGMSEGIVIRRIDGSVRAKKVNPDFKETSHSSKSPTKQQSDAAEFTAMFVTDARIEKQAHKLVDEGEYDSIEMQMMEQLPVAVLNDVMAEEGWNLLNDEYTFECEFDSDFKSAVRSKTSKQCARVLKSMLQDI